MRRLGRILLNALTALSLFLCLASAVLWVRGYFRLDSFGWSGTARPGAERFCFGLESGGGGLAVFTGAILAGVEYPWLPEGWQWTSEGGRPIRYAYEWSARPSGFGYESGRGEFARGTAIIFPAWLPVGAFAPLPLVRLAIFIRRRRGFDEGHCAKCGYDLRATPDRCPECGTITTA